MAVRVLSDQESKDWQEGAIALIKRLGGRAALCATINDPDRYSLQTKAGEVRISVGNVFQYWGFSLRFMEPSRAPFEVLPRGRCRWTRSMDMPMEQALVELELDLRSWIDGV